MMATNVSLEIRSSDVAAQIADKEGVAGYPCHLEAKIKGRIYTSQPYVLGSIRESPLLRIKLADLCLPLTGDLHMVVKLFTHLQSGNYLLGLQDICFEDKKFPLQSEFPIISKHGSDRIYNFSLRLSTADSAVEEVFESTYELGQLETPGGSFISKKLQASAMKISESTEDGQGKKSVPHLLHGVALSLLKAAKSSLIFSPPMKYVICDEFNDDLLGRDTHYIHSPDSSTSKNIFMDLTKKRMIVARVKPQYSIPKVYHSAMTLLPNGNYIMAGGNSKDGVVSFHGLYYFNPLTGHYSKISEIPYNLHKHELHYQNGNILVFGGIDMKEDKGGTNSESTSFASTIYRFNLSNRQWTKGEKMTQKSNERCASVRVGSTYIVNKGNDTCEVFSPAAGQWKAVKVVVKDKNTALNMYHPSTMFLVGGQAHICYKKSKDELTKYAIGKLNVTEKNIECTHIADVEMTNLAFSKVLVKHKNGKVIEKVYIYDQSDVRLYVFVDGIYDEKKSSSEKIKIEAIIDKGIGAINPGKAGENCAGQPLSSLDLYQERRIYSVPSKLPETVIDPHLKRIHSGIRHCEVALPCGNSVILGYFEKIGEDKYRPNFNPVTLRAEAWTCSEEASLLVPSSNLRTIEHGVLLIRNTIFIVGGLEIPDEERTFSAAEVISLWTKEKETRTSNKIVAYRLSNHDWKTIDFLPEGLFQSQLKYFENKMYIYGGLNSSRDHTQKIYQFNLDTYSLVDTGLTFDLKLKANQRLKILDIGRFTLIGADDSDTLAVHSIAEKRTYTVKCNLFVNFDLYSCDASRLDSSEYTCIFAPKGQNRQCTKVIIPNELVRLLEGGTEEVKKYFEDQGVEIPETSAWRVILAKESHDLHALDQVDHSRCFADFTKHQKFAILSEGKDTSSCYAEYSYRSDSLTWPISESPVVEGTKKSQGTGFEKGILSIPYHKHSSTVTLGNGRIFICGGERVDDGKLVATNRCWIFDPISKTYSLSHKMKQARSHHSLLRIGHYLYCFGGRVGSSGNVISESERYNTVTGEWQNLRNLPVPLCNHSSSSLFNKIYIFGGETLNGVLSDKILIYDIEKDSFEDPESYHQSLKLPVPLRSANSLSIAFNTILLAGGESNKGPNMTIYAFEFTEGFSKCQPRILETTLYPHVQGQIGFLDGNVFLVGGNDLNGSETYCLRGGQLSDAPVFRRNLGSLVYSFTEVKNECYVTDSFLHNGPQYKHLYMFGLDQKRDIWRINLETMEWELVEVPAEVNFWNYSIAVTLPEGQIFISGGIKHDLKTIQNDAYLLTPNETSMTAVQLANMHTVRYTHTSVYLNHFVYCMGGRTYGESTAGIHNDCERFNLRTRKWERIANMNGRRCTASATSYKNQVYVMGGYQAGGRCGGIERYDELKDKWVIIPLSLDIPIEASIICHLSDSEIILLGGKDQYMEQKYCTVYDLESCTMSQKGQMSHKHVLGKGAKFLNSLIVIGGSSTYNIEKCDISNWKWEECGQVRIMPSKEFSKTSFSQSI